MRNAPSVSSALAALLTLGAAHLCPGATVTGAPRAFVGPISVPSQECVIREEGGLAVCGVPAEGEAALASDGVPLSVIYSGREDKGGGLTIVLQATAQLEGNAQAKNAFIAAAEEWESLVDTPITVIVNVDYGATRFGQPFPANVIVSTGTQPVAFAYPSVRPRLIEKAEGTERAILDRLPSGSTVPSNAGNVTYVASPTALFRALGLLDAVANPDAEGQYGQLPAIGVSSAFQFDWDPSDGILARKFDFHALAVHEIGHVLGFTSWVGRVEIDPSDDPFVSAWDLFRLRPGTTLDTFGTAERIVKSGGEQVFFAGGEELPLSTGRYDGVGGDNKPANHWKDDGAAGAYIGLMDPTLAQGQQADLMPNDLAALDLMGYSVAKPPAVTDLEGRLDGDVLTLSGTATDADGNIARARIDLLDGANGVVRAGTPFAVSFGSATSIDFELEVTGLDEVPAAVRARLVLIDARGNESNGALTDFSKGDAGAPTVTKVKLKNGSLTIKGTGLTAEVQVEINGLVVAPPLATVPASTGKKLKITGTNAQLNLRSGPNRVRVRSGGLQSNIVVFGA